MVGGSIRALVVNMCAGLRGIALAAKHFCEWLHYTNYYNY